MGETQLAAADGVEEVEHEDGDGRAIILGRRE